MAIIYLKLFGCTVLFALGLWAFCVIYWLAGFCAMLVACGLADEILWGRGECLR